MIALAGEVLLNLLSEPSRAWLASIGRRQSYADGERVHSRGDASAGMGIVIRGGVRLGRLHANGSQSFLSLVRPGQHFGDVVMFGRRQRTHDAVAMGRTLIDHYDNAAFETALDNAEVVRALYRVTSLRLIGALSMNEDLRSLPRDVHLAKILLSLSRQSDGAEVIRCRQEDLAGLLGTSIMSMSKYLLKLRELGFVETGYRSVRLVDRESMSAWIRREQAG